jgi:hypothetical protein
MRTKKFWFIFLATALVLSACTGQSTSANVLPSPTAPTSTTVVQTVVVEKVVTATQLLATPTLASKAASVPTNTPTAASTNELVSWKMIPVAKFSEGVDVSGTLWELPLSTHFAVSTANGRVEAVESAKVGVVGKTDYGWCAEDQLDCPPQALLVRVEVPKQHVSCLSAEMDVSWRIQIENECGEEVPVRISIRYNDVTRDAAELMADYFAIAGLGQRVQDAVSEVGLFVSVKEAGISDGLGYSCWDCLADTEGVNQPSPVPLVADNFSTFGPDTTPAGNSLLPGVVIPLPRPDGDTFTLSFELKVETDMVVWAGRYDARPPTVTTTPTPSN